MAIIGNFLSALFWGLVAATGLTAIVYLVIRKVIEVERLRCWAVTAFLWLLLAFQLTLWIGAAKANSYVDTVAWMVDEETMSNAVESVQDFTEEYPVLRPFVPDSLKGDAVSVGQIVESVKASIREYEMRRALWSGCFILVAVGCSCFMRRERRSPVIPGAPGAPDFGSGSGASGGLRF